VTFCGVFSLLTCPLLWSRKHQLCSLKYCQGKWALKEEERQEGKLFVTCYVSAFALKNGADGLCFSKRWHDAIFNQTTSQEFANQWNPTPNSCSWDKLQVPPHWKLYSKVHDLLEFYVSRAIFLTTSKNYWSARQVFWCNYLSRKNILWSNFWHK